MTGQRHPAAFVAGSATATAGLFPGYMVVLFHCHAPWYVLRCVLTCCGYVCAAVTAGQFGRCVAAYRDKAAQVTGYCHPVREASRR